MTKFDLEKPAVPVLRGSTSVSDMASREGWDAERYAIVLSENIRNSGMSLDMQRERLGQLAQLGAGLAGDQAAAADIAQHLVILESLMHRFSRAAVEAMDSDRPRASEIADRYLSASLRCQKAALACLSALKVLRDGNQTHAPTTTTPAVVAAPATFATAT